MTSDLDALYQSVILDHNKRPRNYRVLEGVGHAAGANPLCGDRLTVYVRIENGVVREATFQGFGCAIAMASASLMTDCVSGRTVDDAGAVVTRFEQMMGASSDTPADGLDTLAPLAGVRRFPMRIKCALLAWQAFRAAVAAPGETVSTE